LPETTLKFTVQVIVQKYYTTECGNQPISITWTYWYTKDFL